MDESTCYLNLTSIFFFQNAFSSTVYNFVPYDRYPVSGPSRMKMFFHHCLKNNKTLNIPNNICPNTKKSEYTQIS